MNEPPIKVAIVEDNDDAREALRLLINGSPGFTCVTASADAEGAIVGLPKQRPDVVLLDIQLPGMSGIECIREIKARLPQTQIVMLTVLEDHDRIFQALTAGAIGYLVKKEPPAKLLESIRDARAGGSPMSSQIARQVVQCFQRPAAAGVSPSPGGEGRGEGERFLQAQAHKQTPKGEIPTAVKLSPREWQVLEKLSDGLLYKEVADHLGISISTVRVHIRHIYEKLHVRNRAEATKKAFAPKRN